MSKDTSPLPFLSPGQTIGVMAPSSYVERADIEAAVKVAEARGYKVFVHPQTFERENQSAGSVLQKSLALQGLWNRKDIDVIWFAGGGNQCLPMLSSLNFEKMKAAPKSVIGFSDTTILLNALNSHTGAVNFHAPVFKNLGSMNNANLDIMFNGLEGKERSLSFIDDQAMVDGEASGRLVGGNLSLAQYLPSLLPDEFIDGSVLFLEDCNEELSNIDRMFSYLRQTGVLGRISGLLLGQFTNLTDSGRPFGVEFDDIINAHTYDLSIPVIKDLPFGHGNDKPFIPFLVGVDIRVSVADKRIEW